jgi:Methyltransferase domain
VATGPDWLGTRLEDWKESADRPAFVSQAQVLELAVQLSRAIPGNIVEFGVFEGASTRVIRDELWRAALWEPRQRRKRIFACDSFRGLPGRYERLAPGTYATSVPVLRGVEIVNGFFEDTLTESLARRVGRISFAHFDADLYSSTRCALEWITPLVQPGTVLLFDEFCGEDPAEERAFVEWMANNGVRIAPLAMFGREPSGKGYTTDRRALFQVLGDRELRKAPPLPLVRLRRGFLANR